RLPGKVVIDETRLYRINATVNGWVTSDLSIAPGVSVKKNQVLATYYSPQLLSAAQSLLHASAVRGRTLKAAPEEAAEPGDEPVPNLNVQQFTESLKNLGMEDHQIEEMIKNRKLIRNVEIISPADGFVLSRNISLGQRFERGTEFYRVADLGHVWILAEVSEADAESLPPGSRVTVTLPRLKKTREATVSSALAAVDPASRTLQLRLEADNPDFLLKPDMFVDLTFELTIPEGTIVPAEAVLRSGLRSAVFVDLGNGRFERRPVVEGARGDDEIQVLSGLGVGERVVVSANFLLDSESRIRNVAGPEEPPATDPVCGMRVDVTASAARSHSGGATWYFCSEQCKRRFEAAPASFLRASSATNAQPRESVAQHSLSGL
ncbi:MAG TPA: efflux RND transporter periplasmic adaptor subunit, partial [Verrucomicrobiae bacterium]